AQGAHQEAIGLLASAKLRPRVRGEERDQGPAKDAEEERQEHEGAHRRSLAQVTEAIPYSASFLFREWGTLLHHDSLESNEHGQKAGRIEREAGHGAKRNGARSRREK